MAKYLNEAYFGLFFVLAGSIYFSYNGLTREDIYSDNDLTKIEGKYLKYSFKDRTGWKKQGHQYYIWIDSYTNPFQIKADYLGIFRAMEFATRVNRGELVELTIPNSLTSKLNTDKNLFVTSIKVRRTIYLDKVKVLEIERRISDSHFEFYLAGGFFLVGLVVFLRKRGKTN